MKRAIFYAAFSSAVLFAAIPASASDQLVQAVQVGNETVRYEQGVPILDLQGEQGFVQIRPLPMEHGKLVFGVAVYNGGGNPVNIDIANFDIRSDDKVLTAFSAEQLVRQAKNRAMWKTIGTAALGAFASTAAANQRDYYTSTMHTPYGGTYVHNFSAPSLAGQFQSAQINVATGVSMYAIQNQMDRAIRSIGNEVMQLSTVAPGQTYAGKVIVDKPSAGSTPKQIAINLLWNGEPYRFGFQLARSGTPAPTFSATALRSEDYGARRMPVAQRANVQLAASAPSAVPTPTVARRTAELVTSSSTAASNNTSRARVTATARQDASRAAMTPANAFLPNLPAAMMLADGTRITPYSATDRQIILMASVPNWNVDNARNSAICSIPALTPVFENGNSIEVRYITAGRQPVNNAVLTAKTCAT